MVVSLAASCITYSHDIKKRIAYFLAPTVIIYGYNGFTKMLYSCPRDLERLLYPNHIPLFFLSQGLIYYCWTQAFFKKTEQPSIHVHVTNE